MSDDAACDRCAAQAALGAEGLKPNRSAEGFQGRVDSRWKCGNQRGKHGRHTRNKPLVFQRLTELVRFALPE